jgi:hypothetical protein
VLNKAGKGRLRSGKGKTGFKKNIFGPIRVKFLMLKRLKTNEEE